MRPPISIRGHVRRSVGPSVRPSVRRSVGPSVRNAFVQRGEMKRLQRKRYSETHLICLIGAPASLLQGMPISQSVR